MNSLTTGFFYVVGLSWALAESCVMASNGSWLPLIGFLVLFIVMFAVLGCIPISTKAVNFWGGLFATVLGVGLVFFAVHSYLIGSKTFGAIKILFAASFALMGILSFLSSLKSSSSH